MGEMGGRAVGAVMDKRAYCDSRIVNCSAIPVTVQKNGLRRWAQVVSLGKSVLGIDPCAGAHAGRDDAGRAQKKPRAKR